jgi:hypothetical protein
MAVSTTVREVPRSEVALTDQTSAAANAGSVARAAKQAAAGRRCGNLIGPAACAVSVFCNAAMVSIASHRLYDPVCRAAEAPGWHASDRRFQPSADIDFDRYIVRSPTSANWERARRYASALPD